MQSEQDIPKVEVECLFGNSLVSKGLLSQEELDEALSEQCVNGGRLGEVLLQLKMLSEDELVEALSEHLSIKRFRFDEVDSIDMSIARILPESFVKRFCLLPVCEKDNKIVVAMADPLNSIAIDIVTLKIKRSIEVVISSPREIHQTIDAIYHGADIEERHLRDLVELEIDTEQAEEDQAEDEDSYNEAAATKAPVIRFVDLLLNHAVKSRASDIHVEPQENSMVVRVRIDGALKEMVPPPPKMRSAITARIKILSGIDIAERRLPQDGRFKMKASGRNIDVRVSVIPTIYGEKVVMRILDAAATTHNIEKLGLEPELLEQLKIILKQPHGIIVVTGPTGSGKSTTLYSAINYLKDPTKNITTVEDPVEYRLAGINQIQVKPKINLDFASCLRAILRQDPDIILIGEIRDTETVQIAIRASLTGHLVLSTFHTNDAPSAISRFIHMGIEPYLLASTLNLVIAQRLVRKICDRCKEPVSLNEKVLGRLKIYPEQVKDTVFYHGQGCKTCSGTGYLGRLPIFEFLVIDNEIREKIITSAPELQIRATAQDKGYGGLLESAVSKMLQGLTTAEEVLRTTFTQDTKV